jgi:cell division septation protein DedD
VQIPPIDDSKFVSRLAGDKGKAGASPAKPEDRPAAATVPGPEAKPEQGQASGGPGQKQRSGPRLKQSGRQAGSQPPDAGAHAASAPAADAATKVEGFVVQLGAFTDVYGANALANRLKKAGYPAFTEPIETNRGKLWRVRVGGYPSRAAAVEARDRLKANGHNGLVAPAK